ncbi:NAD-dependent protein deacetylase sirtuin-2 isoform X2 [Agrilus planipennis]|uniref:NAD-dependent protein deacetylase sirtuin-2 isoform X2 n=1 Tax=Agrilus planipennis TaxID=224129 RepID=A0A1W4WW89_AGRPL|nr:NAD-dependent protein deacetylase sirtuin-2 isoform X2 [Agrilus planipennis]
MLRHTTCLSQRVNQWKKLVSISWIRSKYLSFNEILDDVSFDGLINHIKSKDVTKIITMAGAGISTSAGIPDFRSPGSGLYDNLQKYELPHPQAIFELDFFFDNPKPFFVLAKELYPGSFKPTPCHYFIRLLAEKGKLLRHYTQNIDTLERVAGIPDEKLVEAHGTFHTGHCVLCRKEYTQNWIKEKIFNDEIPICTACPGIVKPDIVFFGENLPDKFHHCIQKDFKQCDLLIILGSSLVVQPFASLVDRVPHTCPRLLINREKVGQTSGIMSMFGFGGGLEFDNPDNSRDIAWLGDCDEGCILLAEKLGFGEELKKLISEEHARIDHENLGGQENKKAKEPIDIKATEENLTEITDVKEEINEIEVTNVKKEININETTNVQKELTVIKTTNTKEKNIAEFTNTKGNKQDIVKGECSKRKSPKKPISPGVTVKHSQKQKELEKP